MMNGPRSLFAISFLIISVIACGSTEAPATVTPLSLFAGQPTVNLPPTVEGTAGPASTESVPTQAPANPIFKVAVMVDTTTEHVTVEHAQAVVDEASTSLREFSPYGLTMVDFINDASGTSVVDMAGRYIQARSSALPNGIVIFSYGDDGQAKRSGGYGYSLPVAGGFKNAFVSPGMGANQIYLAVVDYTYKYMACGYGGGDTVQSTSSLAGECRGQTGIACVQTNGYSMCSNAVGNLYTSTPTHAVSSMIVHSLLHNFGPGGDRDHYATPECNARMGYPPGFFDLQESEYYNGLCPFVYEEFTKSYQP